MDAGQKFLPIGTVCSVRGKQKMVMITGFFSVEYSGNVRMYDYNGCDYPEGLLLRNKICSFNHSDIEKVVHFGLVTEGHQLFNARLNSNANEAQELQTSDVFANIKFDENGVVIFDSTAVVSSESVRVEAPNLRAMVEDRIADNPFRTFNAEVKAFEGSASNNPTIDEWSIFKSIEFDENGVVINAEEH